MTMQVPVRCGLLAIVLAAALLPAGPAAAQRAGGTVRSARADLADMAKGSYFGDLIADSRGSSGAGVRVVVAKIGPNRVRVTSDHARLPAFTVTLARAMDKLQNAGGEEIFLLHLAESPRRLMLTVGEVSWAGTRE